MANDRTKKSSQSDVNTKRVNNDTDKKNMPLARKLTLGVATSLVVGNIIGSGIFGIPSGIAKQATPLWTMIAWIIVTIGTLFIVMSYARLSTKYPDTGGPVVYAKQAYGNFGGYTMSWVWWITSAIGNAAIVSLFVTTVEAILVKTTGHTFFAEGSGKRLAFTLAIIAVVTLINYIGVQQAGKVSYVTTLIKLAVLGLFIVVALFFFKFDNLNTSAVTPTDVGYSVVRPNWFMMIIGAVTYIYWAYTGIESSTLAGGEIVEPEKNIFKSTLYGFVIAAGVYLLVSILMMGVMPQHVLAASETPFPDAFAQMLGSQFLGIENFWYLFINVAIGISVLGALSGWFLTTARCIYAPAESGYFFKEMGHVDKKYQTPSTALFVSACVTSIFVIANFFAVRGNESVGAEFTNVITVAAILNLPTYLGTTIAELILTLRQKQKPEPKLLLMIVLGVVASVVFIVVGVMSGLTIGWQIWLVGLGLAVIGLPLYPLYQKRQRLQNLK